MAYIKPQLNLVHEIAMSILRGNAPKVTVLKPSKRKGVKLDKVSSNSLGTVADRSLAMRLRMNGVLK